MNEPLVGLSSSAARAKLAEVGPNELAPHAERSTLVEIALLFANPLVSILIVASIASAFLGDVPGAIIIVTVLTLGSALNFSQTYRSRRAAERLREGVAPTATVLRDDAWIELPRREIVPGDLVRLSAGDLVPADATLESERDLHTHESALTGESLPVEKRAGEPVWLGTSVVSGSGAARVVRTGMKTKFGEIAERLEMRPPPTEFDRGIRRFGFLIMRLVFFLVLFILTAELAMHRSAMEALLFAVALAVGLTPEFLPMITSVTLAKGAVALARQKVIVKHLSAMQNLGSIDVLCSDKTGTLTSGKMAVASETSDDAFHWAAINAAFETGIKSPLDAAILAANAGAGEGWTKRDEVPFDFERRRISVLVSKGDEWVLVTKGAPEAILPLTSAGPEAYEKYDALSMEGKRVIAVAHRNLPTDHVCTKDDERDLVFDGFVAFADPPLEDAAAAIRALEDDGVAIKVLTGDGEHVARHVCSAVGVSADEIVLGDAIESGAVEMYPVERLDAHATPFVQSVTARSLAQYMAVRIGYG